MAGNYEENLIDKGYGYAARIGFLRPGIIDETVGRQFYRMAPEGVTIVQTSLGLRDVTEGEVQEALERVDEAARTIARVKPDCILLGGSPTVVMDGYGADKAVAARIEKLTGIPSSAAQTAAVEALTALGAHRLALATPFPEVVNPKLATFLEDSGFEVASMNSLSIEYRDLARMPLSAGYELALKSYREAGRPDAIYFPGAPFPVVDLIDRLERELETTVISSLQASLWKGMQMAGLTDVVIDGFGRLLRGEL
jgi:maleate isomerase